MFQDRESLKPVRIAETREQFGVAVIEQDAFDDGGPEQSHSLGKPERNAPAMQWKVRESGTFHISIVGPVNMRA